jgi:hypothetical protein
MAYPGPYSHVRRGSGRRIAIGAAIGLGLGVAIGAKAGSHQPAGTGAKASVVFGAIGAAMGAAIGGSRPFYAWNRHRHGPWHDRQADEDEVASSGEGKQSPQAAINKTSREHAGILAFIAKAWTGGTP